MMGNTISIGQLITFNMLLSYFTNPLENIINLQTKLQSAKVANTRLNEVYLIESEFGQSDDTYQEALRMEISLLRIYLINMVLVVIL